MVNVGHGGCSLECVRFIECVLYRKCSLPILRMLGGKRTSLADTALSTIDSRAIYPAEDPVPPLACRAHLIIKVSSSHTPTACLPLPARRTSPPTPPPAQPLQRPHQPRPGLLGTFPGRPSSCPLCRCIGRAVCRARRTAQEGLVRVTLNSFLVFTPIARAQLAPQILLPLACSLAPGPLPVGHADDRVAQHMQMPSLQQGGTRWRPARKEVPKPVKLHCPHLPSTVPLTSLFLDVMHDHVHGIPRLWAANLVLHRQSYVAQRLAHLLVGR